MSQRGLSSLLSEDEFLVCYDYGMGGLWGVLIAPSQVAIRAKYPDLMIADWLPTWMDEAELATKRETPLWLDDEPPQGLLSALVADQNRDGARQDRRPVACDRITMNCDDAFRGEGDEGYPQWPPVTGSA
ncbi:hypothetical protein GCM10009868_15290 [Terrabacter aerolatus]|uniref:Uncharacterized protein n=1 Tax=Terrabacter aerolatus TaxID=422442 RepID=A0A512D7F8_9MICO|nr:hypothetical protein [Terrabacter aerolatus]GEO32180.1 hypothetical protein TAE01_39900 [Terrabacter aerolatus]